jgi:hypothetical protein
VRFVVLRFPRVYLCHFGLCRMEERPLSPLSLLLSLPSPTFAGLAFPVPPFPIERFRFPPQFSLPSSRIPSLERLDFERLDFVLSCLDLSCCVLSCLVMSCLVLSCFVVLYSSIFLPLLFYVYLTDPDAP